MAFSSSMLPHLLHDLHGLADDVAVSMQPLNTRGAPIRDTPAQTIIQGTEYIVEHGLPVTPAQLPAYIDALMHQDALDDRKYLLEDLLSAMARLPPGNRLGRDLQEKVIGLLYDNLPHPPTSWVASENTTAPPPDGFDFLHRSADGSHYTGVFPTLGMARTPYAQSVSTNLAVTLDPFPSPEIVYERLLKRDKFEKHPGGISSLFFAFANLVIHSIFSTDQSPGYYRNNVSSYLDLSPLYGSSEAEQDSVRRHDGTGKLFDDCFADARLLFMPPSTNALLVLFNRNHNASSSVLYIAEQILNINEHGEFSDPPPEDPRARAYQEEKLFQTARLVNCGFFMQITLGDYVAAILGLVRDGVSWRLDPRIPVRKADGTMSQMGGGNACSIEFNLLYRWHAAVSELDEAWINEEMKSLLNGRNPSEVSLDEFKRILRALRPSGSPRTWSFGGYARDAEGRYSDALLAKILMDATETYAGAFKARGTPEVLRFVELLTIEQARGWGTCSTHSGDTAYATFEEWNPDPEIARAAQELYGEIDNLELHVGLQAEEPKYVAPGAGLCPGYTISRTILADAVALVRGDPFMTVYNTPQHLTSWGYAYTQTDPEDGSYGGLLTRMLFQLLPEYYPRGSSYAHFPFLVPEAMKGFVEAWPGNEVSKYKFSRPAGPTGPTVVAKSFQAVRRVLTNTDVFDNGVEDRLNVKVTLYKPEVITDAVDSLTTTLRELLRRNSHDGVGGCLCVDIVQNVLNMLPVHWISTDVAGVGLKAADNIHGYLLDKDQYNAYAATSSYVYFNTPGKDWSLREKGLELADKFTADIKKQLDEALMSSGKLIHQFVAANDHNDALIRHLAAELKLEGGYGERARKSLASSVFAEFIPTAPIFSKAIAHVVNFYVDVSHQALREEIVKLGATPAIMSHIYEALRLDPPMCIARVTAKLDTTVDGVSVVAGQPVLASLVDAVRDPSVFPDPDQVNPSRQLEHVHIFGSDQRGLLAPEYFERIAPVIVYEVLKLQNIRRSTGQGGKISRSVGYRDLSQDLSTTPSRLLLVRTARSYS
ncbi:heme peroxidase [Vararia minispora EC-137]|uniref:Heme peroxidase n=1 Tax=Vararia minispora EC-137 TaxID=1314806 RepID=A0ACB8QT61_9AGAM|nr:heme peroxidase [Vararia minispora EC-137]